MFIKILQVTLMYYIGIWGLHQPYIWDLILFNLSYAAGYM